MQQQRVLIFRALEKVPDHERTSLYEQILDWFNRQPQTADTKASNIPKQNNIAQSAILPQTPAGSTESAPETTWPIVNPSSTPVNRVYKSLQSLMDCNIAPTESGISCFTIEFHFQDAPRKPLSRGTLQIQQFSMLPQGILKLNHSQGSSATLAELGRTFDIPDMKSQSSYGPSTDLEQEFERLLITLGSSRNS